MPSPASGIELHLYCHGLGDCHLLRLPSSGGDQWIMIDCGIHTSMPGGADRIRVVVDDVQRKTRGKLRAVVGTHEHWDHISAFHPAQELFDTGWTVTEVWLAWTENGSNVEAQRLDKYKGEATRTLSIAQSALQKTQGLTGLSDPLGAVMGFLGFNDPNGSALSADAALAAAFGLEGDRVRRARDRLAQLGPPKYLDPGDVLELTDEVRCYVMAPPHDSKFNKLDDKDLTYNAAGTEPLLSSLQNALAVNFVGRNLEDDPTSPFDGDEGVPLDQARKDIEFLHNHYDNESWRTIDNEWLMPATELALQLDNRTNNSSLVLAFEIIATRHVLIFAADAQIGNWMSWESVNFAGTADRAKTTGKELLERAVFYKVGHHGSRNATMSKGGLELMNGLELAFNPTDRKMAEAVHWGDIPAEALNRELVRRTSGKLIEGDTLDTLDLTKFAAGGALAEDVKIELLRKSTDETADINCVICRIV